MKILQVISSFPPAYTYGGPVKVAYEVSKKLVKRGHGVTVYTTDVLDAHSRFKYDKNPGWLDGIEVYHFKNLSNELAHKNFAIAPMMAFKLNETIKNFDIVHLHEYRSFQAILVHYYAKKYGIPYILQPHGSLPIIINMRNLKKLYDFVWGNETLKDASKVIALTNTEAELTKKIGVSENKIEIVPNGVEMSDFEILPEKGEFKKKYGIRNDEKIILYIGRLHKSKSIDLLVRAFTYISKELNNVRLVLVGPDDGYRLALENLAQKLKVSDKVLIVGFVHNDEKIKAFVDADIFVTPKFSGFPITFLEACACGTTIVTTDNGDYLEWVHNKVGCVVRYDLTQLANIIIKILSDEELKKRFGEEGKVLVREEFSWDKIAKNVERTYEKAREVI